MDSKFNCFGKLSILAVLDLRLDSIILKVLSNLNDSVILIQDLQTNPHASELAGRRAGDLSPTGPKSLVSKWPEPAVGGHVKWSPGSVGLLTRLCLPIDCSGRLDTRVSPSQSLSSSSVGASLLLGYYRAITKFQSILKKIDLLTSVRNSTFLYFL